MIWVACVCSFAGVIAGWAARWFWREWRVGHHHQCCRLCRGTGLYNARAAEEMRQEIAETYR